MARPEPITTERLVLRALEPSDAPALVIGLGPREVSGTLLRVPHPYTMADAEHYLGTMVPAAYESGLNCSMAVTLRGSGELVGGVGLELEAAHKRAELGYWVAVPHWGKGFATEASRAVIAFGFRELGLNKIVAHHYPRNPASGRVLEKIGMQREGLLRRHVQRFGVFEDTIAYGILREEHAGPEA